MMDLLERGTPLVALSRMLAEAEGGTGRAVFIGGEAGIGKTALLKRFTEVVRDTTTVVVGRCDSLSTPRPLGPLIDIAERLGASSIRFEDGKERVFRDTLALLRSPRSARVLVFEDVHWADESTLDLLRLLAGRIEECPALLIATYRDDEVGARHPLRIALGDLATADGVRRLALEPLSPAAVTRMAQGSGLDADLLFQRTGGNPFFVAEVVAAGDGRIPETVRDAVLARAARLSDAGRAALDAAGVIGFRAEAWLLTAVSGVDDAAVAACIDSGLLHAEGAHLLFRHELAREAVLGAIPPTRLADLHRRALDALSDPARDAGEPARLAAHAEGAGDAEAVLRHAPVAARRARDFSAHREAVAQYARALRFADRLDPATRAELLTEFSYESATIDDWDTAIRADHDLIALWRAEGDRVREGWSLSFLTGCLVSSGRFAEAQAANLASIEMLESAGAVRELSQAYATRAALCLARRDLDGVDAWVERSLALLDPEDDDPATRLACEARRAVTRILRGDETGEADLLVAIERAIATGMPWVASGGYAMLGSAWTDVYGFSRAEPWLRKGIEFAAANEMEGMLTRLYARLATAVLHLGHWDEAAELARRVRGRSGGHTLAWVDALLVLARLLARRGDSDAPHAIEEAAAAARKTGLPHLIALVHAIDGEAACLRGDLDRARGAARAGLDLVTGRDHPWLVGELCATLTRNGTSAKPPEWIARPFALEIRGEWAAASAAWRSLGCLYEAAVALARSDDPADGCSALAELEDLGAQPATEWTARRLRESGVRGIPRGPRPSTRAHPAGLTRREAEIVTLLARGLRNGEIAKRLFVSPKTVGHHVSSVLAKLGVATRLEAARAAERMGILQDGEGPPSR
jgi:DNA-binding CsgD family transcriptional regulator/tetratricopeptide (TPR) repeat protein